MSTTIDQAQVGRGRSPSGRPSSFQVPERLRYVPPFTLGSCAGVDVRFFDERTVEPRGESRESPLDDATAASTRRTWSTARSADIHQEAYHAELATRGALNVSSHHDSADVLRGRNSRRLASPMREPYSSTAQPAGPGGAGASCWRTPPCLRRCLRSSRGAESAPRRSTGYHSRRPPQHLSSRRRHAGRVESASIAPLAVRACGRPRQARRRPGRPDDDDPHDPAGRTLAGFLSFARRWRGAPRPGDRRRAPGRGAGDRAHRLRDLRGGAARRAGGLRPRDDPPGRGGARAAAPGADRAARRRT